MFDILSSSNYKEEMSRFEVNSRQRAEDFYSEYLKYWTQLQCCVDLQFDVNFLKLKVS